MQLKEKAEEQNISLSDWEHSGFKLHNLSITQGDFQTDDFGGTTATGVLENNTGYDFDNFVVHFTLYDDNGVVVDTPVDYLQNFTNGTKAQVEFYTYKQISTYEVYCQWYE